jgi:NAD(P)-dependent dehydrogenase (short-subunit alcohol dehydrogenase family)
MEGKTCVITGATPGIGRATPFVLAAMVARIIAVARDKQRGDSMLAELLSRFPAGLHRVYFADLRCASAT